MLIGEGTLMWPPPEETFSNAMSQINMIGIPAYLFR